MDGYPSVGSIVAGRYRIDSLLGEGGMGAVFRASDSQGSAFALKFPALDMRARPGMMSRFANEAVAASRIASEHAVHIFGVEATESGVPFIVMELLSGTDLDQIIERQAPVDIPRSVHFALQILRALQVAHAAGVVHRDVKPANCFVVSHNGEADFIKIIDFGITKLLGDDAANMTRTSVTMGTPAYMSPEQARSAKAAEPRSDLYAVGVILYELLSKKRPYEGDSHNELVVKICTEPPLPIRNARPDLPAELATAVERALVKIPAGRFESAQAFARALAPFADARSQGVLQRIEGGVQAAPLAAALAPTPFASQPGPAPVAASPGNRTAIMEPGAPFAEPPPIAAPIGREPQRTIVADGPMAFAEPAAAAPMSPPPAVIPATPMYESQPSRRGDGGGRGGLIAALGVLAVGLIVGGLYFGGVFGGGSGAAPAPAPAATAEEPDDEPTKKKKKKTAEDPAEPAEPPPPDPTATPPTATKPVVTKPTTTATATASAPKPDSGTAGTTTAPTIVLPPGFPFPTSSATTAPPPASTTAPPATTTAPPATTTPPTATTSAPTAVPILIKKPKIGGS